MEEKKGRGRPRYTCMEALVHRGKVPASWKEDILALGGRGKNKLHFANYLGISRDTLYKIMDRDPKFADTIKKALELSQMWWVDRVVDGFEDEKSQKLNSTLWKYYMENVYRADWKTEQNIDITSKGDKLNSDNNLTIEIIKPKIEDEDTD